MSDAELLSELERVRDVTYRIIASVHGIVSHSLAQRYVDLTQAAIDRGLIDEYAASCGSRNHK